MNKKYIVFIVVLGLYLFHVGAPTRFLGKSTLPKAEYYTIQAEAPTQWV